MLCLSAFISATALSFYMFTTYLTTYMQVVGGAARPTALLALAGGLALPESSKRPLSYQR